MNPMDLAVASFFIWGAVIFIIAFFAWAALKDLFPKYEDRIRDFVGARLEMSLFGERTKAQIPKRATYAEPGSTADYAQRFFETREENLEPVFVPGDYQFSRDVPVYNNLANQYNRKHS